MSDNKLICIGKITTSHGVKGEVKIKSYTEYPEDLTEYGAIYLKDGKEVEINVRSVNQDVIIASIKDINDRNQSDKLRGVELFVYRDQLPEIDEEDEFYYSDLIGLKVLEVEDHNKEFGVVKSIEDHGAGDIIEIKTHSDNKLLNFEFSKANFPEINIEQGYITISPPDIVFVEDEGSKSEEGN